MTSPRKRGAQPHNRNAIKHDFYARQFEPAGLADLAKIDDPAGLDAEIVLMRVTLRRLIQSSRGLTNFESLSRFSHSVSFISSSLTRLLRARLLIATSQPDNSTKMVSDALKRMMEELNIPNDENEAPSSVSLPPSSTPFLH